MSIVIDREIPGRMRFRVAGEVEAEAVLEFVRASFAAAPFDLVLSYNVRSGRYLAEFGTDTPARDRLVKLLGNGRLGSLGPKTVQAARPAPAAPSAGPAEAVTPEVVPAEAPPALARPSLAASPFLSGLLPSRPEPLMTEADPSDALPVGRVMWRIAGFMFRRRFTPRLLRPFSVFGMVSPILYRGLRSLLAGRFDTSVLDASAVGASLLLGDVETAQSIAFLLGLGEEIEEWTREKTRRSIADLYVGGERPAWVQREGKLVQVPAGEVSVGELVVVEAGSRLPVDGTVVEGRAFVNQSSLTGEALPVTKKEGSSVYAGTAVEEGRLVVETRGVASQTRVARIARLIEGSETRKAEVHSQAERLAERVVPVTFLLGLAVLAVTRNFRKAASVLLVDYSCAIKLSTPLAVKSAMLESARRGMLIKGGKYMEKLARADVVILDKTGTLTEARPHVVDVVPFGEFSRDYVLRNSACLEEHFPHPVATAVIRKAEEEDLKHEERHAQVEYIAAHGIASALDGERVLLGSRHFVHDDEGVDVAAADAALRERTDEGCSVLYMAVGGKLAGIIVLEDPMLPEAPGFVQRLKGMGLRVIMLTGDHEGNARRVAGTLDIDEYHSQVMPDRKTEIVRKLQAEGRTVVMVGDGMNDSAALSYADVGVSMRHGAEIAQEACDVLLLSGCLDDLADAVLLSRRLMGRIRRSFYFIMGVNTALLALNLVGGIRPAISAIMHNGTTIAVSMLNTKPLLPPREPMALGAA